MCYELLPSYVDNIILVVCIIILGIQRYEMDANKIWKSSGSSPFLVLYCLVKKHNWSMPLYVNYRYISVCCYVVKYVFKCFSMNILWILR